MTSATMATSDEESPKPTNVIPAFTAAAGHSRRERSIGAILLDAGRLAAKDADRILQHQRETKLAFGDAGKALGVLTDEDIAFALSQQFDHPYLLPGQTAVSETVVAAYHPTNPQIEALRALRSQLVIRWLDGQPTLKTLAIISAAPGEGRSFIAANLAVVFAQLGTRTLLIDADFRNPSQHKLFGLDNRFGLSAALSGRAGMDVAQPIPFLPNLRVLPAGVRPPNPHELLARPAFGELLQAASEQFDVILLDSPPAAATADAQLITVRAGATLIVARKNATRTWRVQGISDKVLEAKGVIVGSILNDY